MTRTRAAGAPETDLESRLHYRFTDRALLERALTHRSCAVEQGKGPGGDYERLEFLGDSLLGFLVSDTLCRSDGEADEGVLTRRKQSVVRSGALAHAARAIGLGEALRLGKGEEGTGGREKPSLLADVFEAVLGAVYVDGGLRAARAFVGRHLGPALEAARGSAGGVDDYKTRLQEQVQGRLHETPRYRLVRTEGPAHARRFEAEVLLGEGVLGLGRGTSRKQAEQEAARAALERLAAEGGR